MICTLRFVTAAPAAASRTPGLAQITQGPPFMICIILFILFYNYIESLHNFTIGND